MHGVLLGAWIACQAFDVTTTTVALQRPDATEVNGLMASGRSLTVKLPMNFVMAIIYHKTTPRTKPIVSTIMAVAGCAPAVSNAVQLHKAGDAR